MSFLDNLFTTGVATALKTPTGQIDVSSSAPVVGRVLKVASLSPPRADWVAESSSGGAPVFQTEVASEGTLNAQVDHAYLCLSACTVTLPDATAAENQGRVIDLQFYAGPSVVKVQDAEVSDTMVEGGFFGTQITLAKGGGVLLICVYQPDDYPAGFWLVHRYAIPTALPVMRTSEVYAVYPYSDLPAPYDSVEEAGVTTISGNVSSTPNIQRDISGSYPVGSYVLMPFLSDVPGLYQVVQDDGGTDWSFRLIEDSSSPADPGGTVRYRVQNGETWGGRTFVARKDVDPFYVIERAPLDVYPANGDVLATGTNTGLTHDNTTDLLPGRVNIVTPSGTYNDYSLVAPLANNERVWGERFAVKSVDFTGAHTLTVNVLAGQIEDPDGLIGSSASFTFQLGTYAEWQLFPDDVWHLVSWLPGNTGG